MLLFSAFSSAVAAAPLYSVTPAAKLSESSNVVRAFNNSGEFVGHTTDGKNNRGFLVQNGKRGLAQTSDPNDFSSAYGLNNAGDLAGTQNTQTGMSAFLRRRNQAQVKLTGLPGDSASAALAMNDNGVSVGFSSGPSGSRAVSWTAGGKCALLPAVGGTQSGRANGINRLALAAGVVNTSAGTQPARWDLGAGTGQLLELLPGHQTGEALGINDEGYVVGSSGEPGIQRRAVLWDKAGRIQDLGTIPNGRLSRALAINNVREVVGTADCGTSSCAFLYTPATGMQDLNQLLAPSNLPEFKLTQAVGINQVGDILATGYSKPKPEQLPPATDTEIEFDDHELPLQVFKLTKGR